MHLCLAVVAALIVLAVGLVLLWRARLPASAIADVGQRWVHPTPRRPPPDHAIRLAELCVLRN